MNTNKHGLQCLFEIRKKAGVKMSVLDRLFAKETDKKRENLFQSVSGMKRDAALDNSAAEAKEQYPEDSKTIDDFVRAIKDASRARHKRSIENLTAPLNAEARFFLSPDRLVAYACLLPPENDGEALNLETFREDLRYEGISYGLLEDMIPHEFSRGYYHIFPVARGTLPQAGEDGRVVEKFQRLSLARLTVQDGSEINFSQENKFQPIRKGTVICQVCPPKPGTDGKDVTGMALPCPPVASAHVSPGKNVTTDEDGQTLTAAVDGLLYIENDQFCIRAQKIIDGDLDQFQAALQVSGNLYINGNVDHGASVKATGDIIITGKVGQAQITSTDGTIHVRQGIFGTDGKTFITATGQVQAPVLEWAQISAGTSVFAEVISNCTIQCGAAVHAMTGRGLIVACQICAEDSILCLRVGNVTGERSRFSVGYPLGTQKTWKQLDEKIAETQKLVDSLWESVLKLQKKGWRIVEEEQSLLKLLKEQRDLNLERLDELKKERKEVSQLLDKKTRGRIRCEKLYPVLEVEFGKLTEEITTVEENCSIHVEDGAVLLR